jgi:hypothetical protein
MLRLLDWAYGPAGQTDPYYLLLRDFILLMPWWYPWFWVAIIVAVLTFRYLRRWRRNRVARRGMRRVRERTERLLDDEAAMLAAARLRRNPANDHELACQPQGA